MSEFQSSNFTKENGGTPNLVGRTEFTSPYFFVPPSGDTASRPQSCARGTLRFNTDIGTLEVYKGDLIGWEQIKKRECQYLGDVLGDPSTANGSNAGNGTRMCIVGGYSGPVLDTIDYITITTLGDAKDFGDLTNGRYSAGAIGNSTRGFSVGGYNPGVTNQINVFNFASKADATDVADLVKYVAYSSELSNEVRGVVLGGTTPGTPVINNIQYFSIFGDTVTNSVDFGDLTYSSLGLAACASTTRGVTTGGSPGVNTMNFIRPRVAFEQAMCCCVENVKSP